MYVRMSQYCDKVVVLKSVSLSVEAFDADGNQIKGLRKNTTVQVASFGLDEPIYHPEIPGEKATEFQAWRETQKLRIEKAFIDNAAAGKLGGVPLLKAKSGMGHPDYKVGEFSGLISTLIAVQPGMIKSVMNGGKSAVELQQDSSASLADRVSPEAICGRMKEIAEDLMRFMNLTSRKGTEIFSVAETLNMRAAWSALGCALDKRGIGYKMTGDIDGRNAAAEGAEIFSEIKRHVQE
ncbi:hypothetical protein [Pseudomonas monteilii]|uniref:hypothetical protein n=1 Tax=Pseudomonas monteilii TaxID=76759 RepID=UPI0036F166A6